MNTWAPKSQTAIESGKITESDGKPEPSTRRETLCEILGFPREQMLRPYDDSLSCPKQESAFEGVRDILAREGGGWCAYLWGPTGVGKTYLVSQLVAKYGKVWAIYTKGGRMLDRLREEEMGGGSEYWKLLTHVHLLVVDEVDEIDHTKQWQYRKFTELVDYRCHDQPARTILIGNLELDELQRRFPKVRSRVGNDDVWAGGRDRRLG